MNFGHWITSPQLSRNCVTADPPSPAPLFRRAFECSGFTTGRVRLSGVGYHELYLNGRKVGDRVLDPAVSCYEKRVRFVTFDITEYLHPGTNVIGVILGNGWYNPSTAEVWNFFKAPWRDCVKFTIELEIDGRLVLGADESWKWTSGPILFDALRNGETYDARCEIDGWLGERYDDSGWLSAVRIAGPGGMLDEQKMPPCKVLQTIPMTLHPAGRVYDAGQNLSGWARIAVQGEAGAEVKLEYAERITEDGDLDTNFQDTFIKSGDFQTDRYILKGSGGVESWEPRFTYHGFRYVRVSVTGAAEVRSIEARFVGTAFDSIGKITTSDETINQLQKMTRWSFRSNFVGIPTDCPHREKNGWTGDAAIAADTGLYNFDVGSSYAEWLQLLADCQRRNGQLPGIAPTGGWGFDWGSGPAWDCALFSIPYEIYLHTGDDTAIRQNYPAMKRYLDFCGTMESDGILAFGLGDWASPEECGKSPSPALTSTGYYYMDAKRISSFARLLGEPEEEAKYRDLAERVRAAFNRKFHLGDGLYGDGSGKGELTALGCALYHDLVEPEFRQRTLDRLVALCREGGCRAYFGILGAKYVPRVLAENGHADLACRFFTQREFPGWAHWIDLGLTTLGEHWDGTASRNHIMFGDLGAWFFRYLGGFRHDPERPGCRHLIVAPCPVVESCRAEYRGYVSEWEVKDGTMTIRLTVPPNSSAMLQLPGEERFELGSGIYVRSAKL